MGPKLKEQLCYSLYSTSRAVTQAYKSLLQPLNLTYPQYVVMMALWENDGLMISKIAEETGIGNATLSPLLKRLETNGYIERQSEDVDERKKRIVLTSAGRKIGRQALKASERAFCATGLSDKEAIRLMVLCGAIKKELASV
ncbi:MAG: MarR family transcriptional regulator [Gammaproteobacteria bacterium]|nr:MarR family transcriptional regulator [Gammaproteobacteria bacterium]